MCEIRTVKRKDGRLLFHSILPNTMTIHDVVVYSEYTFFHCKVNMTKFCQSKAER